MTDSPIAPGPPVVLRTPLGAWLPITWLSAAGIPAAVVFAVLTITGFPTGFWQGLAAFGWITIGPVGTAIALRRCVRAAQNERLTRPSIVRIFAETAGKLAASLAMLIGTVFAVVALFGGAIGGTLLILLVAVLLGIPGGLIIAVPLGALSGSIASWTGYRRAVNG